ncbi:MAG: hypothetical protein B6I31_00990 [Desulfobacteraceae bacterium 4572_19]|nr:MAG: hypothetical protein B6I31_00990 [Desulfobacteraceae bacterium 4572_19]
MSDKETMFSKMKKESPYIILIILSLLGVGIISFSTQNSSWYWQIMIPIFGITCILTEWKRTKESNKSLWGLVRTQFLHWGAFFLIMRLDFLSVVHANMNDIVTGMVMLMLLAFSTFIAGIYIGWRFCVVGLFLAGTVAVLAFLEKSTILLFMIMLIVAILLIVVSYFWTKHKKIQ